jgi:hypothetical protein
VRVIRETRELSESGEIPGSTRAASRHARRDVAAHRWKAHTSATTTLTEARYVPVTFRADAARYPIGLSPNVFRDIQWSIVIIHETGAYAEPPIEDPARSGSFPFNTS